MSVKTAVTLWAVIILGLAVLTMLEVFPNTTMASILPLLALSAVIHINALRHRQAAGGTGSGC